MNIIFALLIFLSSANTFSQQYIQSLKKYRHPIDALMMNLTLPEGRTLLLSSGIQHFDEKLILINVELEKTYLGKYIYLTTLEEARVL